MSSDSVESQNDNDNSLGGSAVENPSEATVMKTLGEKRKHDFEDDVEGDKANKKPYYLSEWLMRRPPAKAHDNYAVTARRQIVHLIKDKKYKDAWTLLLAILETDRVSVSLFWEIGLLLTKKLNLEDPADYLQRAYVSCAGPKGMPIYVEWVQELMRQGRYDEANMHVETYLERNGRADHPDVLRLSALLYTRSPPSQAPGPTESSSSSSSTETVLHKAYHALPDDPDVVGALLLFLKDNDPDQVKTIARNALELGSSRHDARLMKVALKYYRPPVEPFNKWLDLMLPLHLADPSTDPDIYGKIYFGKMIHTRQNTRDKGMKKYVLRCILSFLFDRLEVGCHDEWTLDVLESTLKKLSRTPYALLIRLFEHRKVLTTILEIQPEDPSVRSRLLALHESIARYREIYYWLHPRRSAKSTHTQQ